MHSFIAQKSFITISLMCFGGMRRCGNVPAINIKRQTHQSSDIMCTLDSLKCNMQITGVSAQTHAFQQQQQQQQQKMTTTNELLWYSALTIQTLTHAWPTEHVCNYNDNNSRDDRHCTDTSLAYIIWRSLLNMCEILQQSV